MITSCNRSACDFYCHFEEKKGKVPSWFMILSLDMKITYKCFILFNSQDSIDLKELSVVSKMWCNYALYMYMFIFPVIRDNLGFSYLNSMCNNIIQILTATVMKYHVSVDCQESYIFPRGNIFPKRAALRENIITRENITRLAPPTRDISSVPVNICYIRWSKWMISSKFDGALWLSQSLVTRLGVCVQTMWTQTWQLCALSIMTFYC